MIIFQQPLFLLAITGKRFLTKPNCLKKRIIKNIFNFYNKYIKQEDEKS